MTSSPIITPPDFDASEARPMPAVTIRRGGQSAAHAPLMGLGEPAMASMRPVATSPADLRGMLAFERVTMGLIALYPRFQLRDMADARVALGAPVSDHAARVYDSTPSHIRNAADALMETPGPKTWLVTITRGYVHPYSDLLTVRPPRRIIARSLYSICKAAIDHGCFTWEAAEREFGIRLRNAAQPKRFIDVAVGDWGKRREAAAASDAPSVIIAGGA